MTAGRSGCSFKHATVAARARVNVPVGWQLPMGSLKARIRWSFLRISDDPTHPVPVVRMSLT